MKEGLKKAIKVVLSFALAIVLVYFAFRGVEWEEFWEGFKLTNWWWFSLSIVVSIAALWFRSERWHMMMRPLDPDVKKIDIWDANNVGNLANVALPGAGEFTRCGMMSNKKARYDKTFGTIIMERLWDMVAIVVIMAIALASKWDLIGSFFIDEIWTPAAEKVRGLGWFIVLFLVICVAFCWICIKYKEKNKFFGTMAMYIEGVFQGLKTTFVMDGKLLFTVYTILTWLMYILTSYFVMLAMPDICHLDFWDALFLSAIGNFASIIPVPGGIGAYHYLLAISLSAVYATTWETGILFATLSHESHGLLVLILGIISYVARAVRKKKK